VTRVYAVIAQLQQENYPTAMLCEALDVHRSRFYAWQRGSIARRAERDAHLKPLVREVFREHKGRYGARRIARELIRRGHACGVVRVGRLLAEMGLRAIQPKSYRPRTTESRHRLGYSPNLLLNRQPPASVNLVWVGDISYVPLQTGGFLYMAILMDLYSRRIVAWDLRDHMQESLVLGVLREAISVRQPPIDLIHHTDRGGQYAGKAYRVVLARAGMRQSMSRADDCYDNAFMESCFATIKRELQLRPYDNWVSARRDIGDYVRYYKSRRMHSSIGYRTPVDCEAGMRDRDQHVSRENSQVARNKLGGSQGNPARGRAAASARDLGGVSRAAKPRC